MIFMIKKVITMILTVEKESFFKTSPMEQQ
jgi:hypothetical protein